jgi:hypothetical protein
MEYLCMAHVHRGYPTDPHFTPSFRHLPGAYCENGLGIAAPVRRSLAVWIVRGVAGRIDTPLQRR